MARPLTHDDIDWARVAAWRHAALHNPIIGKEIVRENGVTTTRVLRLRDVPKQGGLRKRFGRIARGDAPR